MYDLAVTSRLSEKADLIDRLIVEGTISLEEKFGLKLWVLGLSCDKS